MLIKTQQVAFTCDGKDCPSYRLLKNKVQCEIKSPKYQYYHHKVSDFQHTDLKRWWKQIKSVTWQDIQEEWFHQFIGDDCPDIKSLANSVNDDFISPTAGFEPLFLPELVIQQVFPELLEVCRRFKIPWLAWMSVKLLGLKCYQTGFLRNLCQSLLCPSWALTTIPQ